MLSLSSLVKFKPGSGFQSSLGYFCAASENVTIMPTVLLVDFDHKLLCVWFM